MKLIDFLNVCDNDMFIKVGVNVCGIGFETRRSTDFFKSADDELKNKKVKKIYMIEGELLARLED